MYINPTDIVFTEKHKDEMLKSALNSEWKNHISTVSNKKQPYQFITDYTGSLKLDEPFLKVKEIVTKRIKKPEAIFVMRLPPWENMHVHIDTSSNPGEYRRTIMMTLLSPRNYTEETRLEYYKEDKTTVIEKHIYDERSVLTDTSVYHRCFNQTPEWRYSLQITFKDEIKNVLKHL